MPVPVDKRNKLLSYLNIVYDHIEDHEQIHVEGLRGLFREIRDHGGIQIRIRKVIRAMICMILIINNTEERHDAIIKLKVIKDYLKQMIDTLKIESHLEMCILDRQIDRHTSHWPNIQYTFSMSFSQIGLLLHEDEVRSDNDVYRMDSPKLIRRNEMRDIQAADLDG